MTVGSGWDSAPSGRWLLQEGLVKLFARKPPTEDLSGVVAELRSRLKSIQAERQKAQDAADSNAVLLANAENARDRLTERVERQRVVLETVTAERDKAQTELATRRIELSELRQQIEVERQEFQSKLRVHAEESSAAAQKQAVLIRDGEAAAEAIHNMLVALGR